MFGPAVSLPVSRTPISEFRFCQGKTNKTFIHFIIDARDDLNLVDPFLDACRQAELQPAPKSGDPKDPQAEHLKSWFNNHQNNYSAVTKADCRTILDIRADQKSRASGNPDSY